MGQSRDPDELLTVEEVARILKIAPKTVRRWLASEALAGVRVGRQWRVKRSSLAHLLGGELGGNDSDPGSNTFVRPLDLVAVAPALLVA